MTAARHSGDSKIILLCWVAGVGWCGCRYHQERNAPDNGPCDHLLLRVDDLMIISAERGGLPFAHMGGDDNG